MAISLFSLGTELYDLKFNGILDWLFTTNDVFELWTFQPTYIISQGISILGGILTLLHALKERGCLPYLWFSILLYGVLIECWSYLDPNIHNFWHSQTAVMFLGRLLPLHIIFLYPAFYYNAMIAVRKAHLPSWAEPFAAGLVTVLIDLPFDMVGVKFLHWTWHDTDPNIGDRNYWVPWTSYYFHACFVASFSFWYHVTRSWLCKTNSWEFTSHFQELKSVILSAILGIFGGVFMFVVLYHPLHDIYLVHTEVITVSVLFIFLLIVWSGDRNPTAISRSAGFHLDFSTILLFLYILLHYSFLFGLTVFGHPENEISTGLHQQAGRCELTEPLQSISGMILYRNKYLCVSNYSEPYDFHCLNGKTPNDGVSWYTICGTPFHNRVEYILIASAIYIAAIFVFVNLHCCSGKLKESQKHKQKMR